jgi:Zn-dependent protease with chaperone function
MVRGRGHGVILCAVGLVVGAGAARAEDPDTTEKAMRDEVAAAGAEAVAAWDEANAAREANRLEEAVQLFERSSALAPSVDHPIRRACGVLTRLDRLDDALALCEEALVLRPDSPFNQSTTAGALALRNRSGDAKRALRLARAAVDRRPDDASLVAGWCEVAVTLEAQAEIEECAPRLLALDPDGVLGNYLNAVLAAQRGELAAARRYLDTARAGGMPDEAYRPLATALDAAAAESESSFAGAGGVARTAAWIAGGWLAGLVLLLATGWILSRLTLRAASRVGAGGGDAAGHGTAREQSLRRIYRIVILISGVWFYLSVPILLASILVGGGGIIWLFVAAGHIPIKLVLLIGLMVIVTVGAVLRSLFVRGEEGELGVQVDLAKNPRFRDLLQDVAGVIGTRPVDNAYLTASTDMAVTERGGLWKAVSGRTRERCLIMGVGLLDGMKEIELRSVLAHEYGHFRNQDTAGGGFALAVRRSLTMMIVHLARSGAATWYNPVWWMLRLYHRVYLVVTQGASRLQEVLADRWAVSAFGSEAFVRGYTHVIERSVRFDRHVNATLQEVVDGERPLPNLYRYQPAAGEGDARDEEAEIAEAMAREPTAWDSHPAPQQRLAWARALAVAREPAPEDERPAWELFADRDALEARMTAEVREAVAANHGVAIGG